MSHLNYPFTFLEDANRKIEGSLELTEPLPCDHKSGGGFFRIGKLAIDDCHPLQIVLYHNDATSKFIYLHENNPDKNLLDIIGVTAATPIPTTPQKLPGQLCLGSDRAQLIGNAVSEIIGGGPLASTFAQYKQQNLAVFPIAREGLKYQVAEAIYSNYGYYCDEIVLDAHHVFDSSVPVYNRTVELTLFKDKDLDQTQKENIAVAFLADSIASGLVMKEVVARVSERFENLKQIEVISPLATIRGLCRLAQSDANSHIPVRVHVFETLLNALPPDFYYSAHFPDPKFHICPDLEEDYRAWWGKDAAGSDIADTACAGYGWSEVFYSPRKQIQMMNSQLQSRHDLTIADIVVRNLKK
ncbi:MAG TPA: hypothetical protein DIW44_14045 [Anaerolineaceae bacterium]|nr:hypothetical protein [Anaerolineaceae bacterium]